MIGIEKKKKKKKKTNGMHGREESGQRDAKNMGLSDRPRELLIPLHFWLNTKCSLHILKKAWLNGLVGYCHFSKEKNILKPRRFGQWPSSPYKTDSTL